jgi:succinate dehydrogenase / fumarate reductase iron-sulfur subunit
MLFTAAKVTHLARIPQGQTERWDRVLSMVDTHDAEGFGNCTNHGACQEACPKGISIDYIAQLNRDLIKATLSAKPIEAGKDA